MKGFLASLLGAALISCSGCGGGGGGGGGGAIVFTPPAASAPAPAPVPSLSITKVDSAPVLTRGPDGAWDDADLLNPSVIQWNGALHNYYSGYDGTTWRTGLAVSTDNGLTWQKKDSPVLELGGWSTQYIAANGSAIVFNGEVLYYYQGMDANGTQKIGLAKSSDGEHFTALPNPVLDVGEDWDGFAVADPYVVRFGNTFYMYYLGMSKDHVQLMGVATSTDGVNWKKTGSPILPKGLPGSFDESGQGEPSVVYEAPFYYMIYTGRAKNEVRDIGWAVSSDAVHWERKSDALFAKHRTAWNSEVICDTTLIKNGDGSYSVWFGGGNKAEPAQGLNGDVGRFVVRLH